MTALQHMQVCCLFVCVFFFFFFFGGGGGGVFYSFRIGPRPH